MSTEWSKTTKHIVGVGLAVFGVYILYLSRSVLTLVIIAALAAFLLMPVVSFLHNRLKLPRIVAVLLSYIVLLILLLLAPLLLLPPILDGVQVIINLDYELLVKDILVWTEENLIRLSELKPRFLGFTVDLGPVVAPALEFVQSLNLGNLIALPSFETIVNSFRSAVTFTYSITTSVAGRVFSGFLTFILTLLYAIYISLDAHRFTTSFLRVIPKPYRPEIAILLSRLRRIWRAYFRGQIILMITIGLVTWAGNTAIGLPGAFTMAVFAGLMELIPNLGPVLAAIPAVLVALLQGSTYLDVSNLTFALIVIGLYVAVQQLENYLVVPRVLGDAVELHPLIVMIGVVVGFSAGGILGALLAAPVIASGREVLNYLYAKILSQNPFPPRPPEPERVRLSFLERIGNTIRTVQEAPGRMVRRMAETYERTSLLMRLLRLRISTGIRNTLLSIVRFPGRVLAAITNLVLNIKNWIVSFLVSTRNAFVAGIRRMMRRLPLLGAGDRQPDTSPDNQSIKRDQQEL